MDKIYKINNSTVKILFGSILQSDAEVIVSSDDCYLSMGGGISKCILQAAGVALRQDARKKIPAHLGEIVITTAGDLKQKFIFHAITIDNQFEMMHDMQSTEIYQFIIKHSIKETFRIMAMQDIHSIAFPAIGTGRAGIPFETVAYLMSEAISEALTVTNKQYSVEIYLLDRYGRMDTWDFLPFFESFACVARISSNTFSESKMYLNDYSSVEIIDNANEQHMEHQVFISYSRKDTENIKPICSILNELKVKYWIDVDGVYSGANYKEVIYNAIKTTKIVVFISSVNSNASANVAKEISLADEYRKIIIPIRLDKSPYAPRISYDLSCIDHIDYSDKDDWALEKFRQTIQARLFMLQRG